ncbi:MAG TPA: hypothetical protein VGX00_08565 [Thermoplasmata archaeon]|nr:hypothetical protein [Thermoplasmata archaeon]
MSAQAIPTVGRGQPIYHGLITLGKGREWHSTPFNLLAGAVVKMDGRGTTRFFAGMFSQAEYDLARQRSPMMFPFRLNTDQVVFNKAYNVTIATAYRIVIRVSVWQKPGQVQLDVDSL